jgi:Zn-finger nucleic acid-binding protein
MALLCPRDGTELNASHKRGVDYQACPQCDGGWFDLAEMEALEATAASGDALAGTLEYAKHPGDLKCPSCGQTMQGFDFRGENLHLDACESEHGYWLDAGEAEKVRELMRKRMQDLQRSARTDAAWYRQRERGFAPTLIERIERVILGPRR